MNFRNILNEIEKSDPAAYEQLSSRRDALRSFGAKVAAAAVPVALGSLFTRAYGKTTSPILDSLNFILKVKYLEYNFFHVGNNTGGLIPAADLPGFKAIEAQELAHINYLTSNIKSLGGTPYTPPNYTPTALNPAYIPSGTYDFTGGAKYPNVFSDYPSFLIIAQVLEDTSVHSIKGYLPAFLGNATQLTQFMQLQSTEGRHAAHVRLVRKYLSPHQPDEPAPWITNNIPPLTELQPYYVTEENAQQAGVMITSLPGVTGTIPVASATAAFDESYDQTRVQTLIAPFFM